MDVRSAKKKKNLIEPVKTSSSNEARWVKTSERFHKLFWCRLFRGTETLLIKSRILKYFATLNSQINKSLKKSQKMLKKVTNLVYNMFFKKKNTYSRLIWNMPIAVIWWRKNWSQFAQSISMQDFAGKRWFYVVKVLKFDPKLSLLVPKTF